MKMAFPKRCLIALKVFPFVFPKSIPIHLSKHTVIVQSTLDVSNTDTSKYPHFK